jgi:hypothetical protein
METNDDIKVDTPLGKTVGEIDHKATYGTIPTPIVRQTILALCKALREERGFWEEQIRDDMVRAGLDPRGTVGLAQVHIMVERIAELEKVAVQATVLNRDLNRANQRIADLEAALRKGKAALDELAPGMVHIACKIAVVNEGLLAVESALAGGE